MAARSRDAKILDERAIGNFSVLLLSGLHCPTASITLPALFRNNGPIPDCRSYQHNGIGRIILKAVYPRQCICTNAFKWNLCARFETIGKERHSMQNRTHIDQQGWFCRKRGRVDVNFESVICILRCCGMEKMLSIPALARHKTLHNCGVSLLYEEKLIF